MVIFTSICANYLHKARTLAKSVKDNIKDSTFIVCLLETELKDNYNYEFFDEIILSKDCWEGNFERFIFKHTIVEASTSVKGQFFRFLYKKFPNENKFVYLDPDTYVYSDFYELKEILCDNPIVVCPHLLQPGNIDMELSSAAHGVFNLGFLAVNNSDNAKSFIDWWSERLYLFCYDEKEKGIFTDQKWIGLAPCFFDVYILKHRGYDFATWSLLDCGMEEINGEYFIKGDSLRFIHFSGYGKTIENCMKKWLPDGEHPFKKLYSEYSEIHDKNNYDAISKTKWSYDYFVSGEKILEKTRYEYRKNNELMFKIENPFEKSNSFIIENSILNNKQKLKEVLTKFIKKIWR
ncbi:glycosyltransferase [Peptoanaerobacter stomatis]|uniref:glycosyltransferase n=1 Tax=Peptoanaerobacter stomatis TaxID=796937 RepID=UPI003F9FE71A